MARALQCPDCGNRHPLDEVAHLRTFRCDDCGRLLKVPASVAVAAAEVPSKGSGRAAEPESPSEDDDSTQVEGAVDDATEMQPANGAAGKSGGKKVPPSQRGNAIAEQRRKTVDTAAPDVSGAAVPARVPRPVRAAVWLAALPIGFVPVVILGRVLGYFSVDRAVDVFVGVGFGRFLPLLFLLVPWALVTATVAHLAIEGIARLRDSWGGDPG